MANPKKYRDLASDLRNEAIQVTDSEWRQKLLEIARLYESLAIHVEGRGQYSGHR
jgi:hypothetical protein